MILLAIESSTPDSTITNSQLSIEGHDLSVVALHVEMLKNAGFIDAVNKIMAKFNKANN